MKVVADVGNADTHGEVRERSGVVSAVSDEHPSVELLVEVDVQHLSKGPFDAAGLVPITGGGMGVHRRYRATRPVAFDERDQSVDVGRRKAHFFSHVEGQVTASGATVVSESNVRHLRSDVLPDLLEEAVVSGSFVQLGKVPFAGADSIHPSPARTVLTDRDPDWPHPCHHVRPSKWTTGDRHQVDARGTESMHGDEGLRLEHAVVCHRIVDIEDHSPQIGGIQLFVVFHHPYLSISHALHLQSPSGGRTVDKRRKTVPNLGVGELVIVLLIVMLIFGAGRLPQIGESLGKAVRNLKRGLNIDDDIDITPTEKQVPDKAASRVEDAEVETKVETKP